MRLIALISIAAMFIIVGCSREAKSDGPPIGSEPITPVAESADLSAEDILEQARQTMSDASSFEITRTTLRDRVDDDSEDVTQVKISGDSGAYIYSLHGRFINESLAVDGLKYSRGRYIGQEGAKWEEPRQSSPRDIEHARNFIRNLNELSDPELIGTRDRGDKTLYVLQGVSPIPITYGGRTLIEPGMYTLEVDAETMASVRLVYGYVSSFHENGVPSSESRTDTTVTIVFRSVNETVTIESPAIDEIIRPNDMEPTPDDRFPATPTPPSR